MEAYVDNMVVKTTFETLDLWDLKEIFDTFDYFNLKLNPMKCAFGVKSKKFLGFRIKSCLTIFYLIIQYHYFEHSWFFS